MKKTLLFLAIIACAASCKKEYPVIPTLNGTWKLNSIQGGFAPNVEVPEEEKDSYVITTNSHYIRTDKNKVETRGTFTIALTEENNGFRFGTISFSNPKYSDAFAFKADTMIIGTSALDGPSYKYIRIKK